MFLPPVLLCPFRISSVRGAGSVANSVLDDQLIELVVQFHAALILAQGKSVSNLSRLVVISADLFGVLIFNDDALKCFAGSFAFACGLLRVKRRANVQARERRDNSAHHEQQDQARPHDAATSATPNILRDAK